eukprot:11174243-Lingulodinium_polyedra.AAC.1
MAKDTRTPAWRAQHAGPPKVAEDCAASCTTMQSTWKHANALLGICNAYRRTQTWADNSAATL